MTPPMTTSTIDESQGKAARVAGFFYLLTFAIVVAEWAAPLALLAGFWRLVACLSGSNLLTSAHFPQQPQLG